jgi:hypothetical protein
VSAKFTPAVETSYSFWSGPGVGSGDVNDVQDFATAEAGELPGSHGRRSLPWQTE